MRIEFVWIVIVVLFWGGWPLVSRSSGVGGPVGSLLLSLFGLIPIAIFAWWEGMPEGLTPSALAKLAIAGGMMGIGLVAFNLLANSDLEASVSIPIVDAGMLMVTAIGAIWFFGEAVTTPKLAGVALLVAGIALLRPS